MILYHKLFSGKLGKWGSERLKFSTKSLKTLNEIFGGIKTIKIFNVEKIFSNIFSKNIITFSSVATKHGAFTNYPKITLEMSAILIIFSTLILINYSELDMNNVVPIFGLFIAAAFRLLPSVNKLMQGFNNISFHQPSIIMMENEYKKLEKKIDNIINEDTVFEKEIKLRDLNFLTIKKILFTIKKI